MKEKALTIQQETFCQKYCEYGDASKAYREAYPKSLKWKDSSVWSHSSHLMANSKVKARIDEIKEALAKAALITKEEIISLCVDVIRGKQIPDCMEESNVNGVKSRKTKGMSKAWAVERISKMLGFDAPQELKVKKAEEKEMSIEELEKEIERLSKLDDKEQDTEQ